MPTDEIVTMPVPNTQQIDAYLAELRTLWNRWDPLGVEPGMNDATEDEYDAYLGTTLSLLMASKPIDDVTEFLTFVVSDQMEFDEDEVAEVSPETFAQELMGWYASKAGAGA